MPSWAYLLSALTLGATTAFATTAIASDLPKQGTFSVASKAKGAYQEISQVSPIEVGVWEETGTIGGEGLLKDMMWRCVWMPEVSNGSYKDMVGYCVSTSPEGDQVVFGTKWQSMTIFSPSAQVVGYSIAGNGKYSGIVANYKANCEIFGGAITDFTDTCDGQGSYTLP